MNNQFDELARSLSLSVTLLGKVLLMPAGMGTWLSQRSSRLNDGIQRRITVGLRITATVLFLAPLCTLAQPNGPGTALSFNGAGYVSIATTGSLTGTFTVELWANPGTDSPTDLLALIGSRTPAEFGFDMKFWRGHLIHGDIGNDFDWLTTSADAEFIYPAGAWVHLAYVVTPTNYTNYVNGLLSASGVYPADNPVLYDANHQMTIARIGSGSEFMTGQIDEVRVWNRARASSQIQTNLQRRLTGSESGLMGYWRFDEGSGPIVNDGSGHGFLGLLFGGPAWVNSTAPIERLVGTTGRASQITPNSATLNGTVFPNNQNAGAWFEYGPTANYGNATPAIPIDGFSGAPVAVSHSISGLSSNSLYHFRLVATNGTGTSYGADSTFTASEVPLIVNGGFEAGDFTGWTQSGYTLENYVDMDPMDVHSGIYGAGLGPVGTPGYLSQTVPTTPGQLYLISLWLNNPAGDSPNEFSVMWDGADLLHAVNLPAHGWTNIQLRAVAATSATLLRFGFRNDPDYFGFDDVSVVSIPPPEFLPGGLTVINDNLSLMWTSLAGLAYQLQYTTSLESPTWNDLGSPITATDSTTTAFDPIGNDPQRFYRLIMLP